MGYMLRQIEKQGRWVATFRNERGELRRVIPAPPVRRQKPGNAKPMVTRAPGKHDRTFEELQIAAAKRREEAAAKREERARQREATQVQRPGTWDRIRTRLGGLFRRKV